jgi:expansin (peptidoglycan-binding protein)
LNNPKPLVVAPNKQRWYNGSAACGECLEVTGPKGSVVVLVVDSCPIDTPYNDCGNTGADLDLSPAAFEAIEDLKVGKTAVTFQVVPCNVAGPMQYQFKDGSSQWWTAIQVRNHRHPIKTVDYLDDKGHWTNMPRADYNYFIESGGVGARPHGLSLRITSIYGQVVEDTVNVAVGGSALDSKTAFPGTQQFD